MGRHFVPEFFLIVLALLSVTSAYRYPDKKNDLIGDYCKIKDGVDICCDGRIDSCAKEIQGTMCYCDQFCDREVNPDCCPDYWEVCLGHPSPKNNCDFKGTKIEDSESVMDNCNLCTCNDATLTCEHDDCMISQQLMDDVNGDFINMGWSATNYTFMWGRKLDQGLLKMTGTLPPDRKTMRMYPIKLKYDANAIPKTFDASKNWPYLSSIYDQGWCGSSWAFSTISVAQDRLLIASKGVEYLEWSVENLVSCNVKGQQGCNGGHIERAWGYLRRYGVVPDICFPYESGTEKVTPKCMVKKRDDLNSITCSLKEFPASRTKLYSTEPAYRIASKEEDIMWELMTNGPVQAYMSVHQDFLMYKGGIYKHSTKSPNSNSKFSTHSIKLLGWGEDVDYYGKAVKYWLGANSWGTDWGLDGKFKIRRGSNESDIEQFILTVRSRVSRKLKLTRRSRIRFNRRRRT